MLIIGILSILFLLILLIFGIPIANVFFIVGLAGGSWKISLTRILSLLGQSMYYTISSPVYVSLPLFILMGSLAMRAGFAKKAYDGINIMTAGLPGSLGVATCYSCAAFGAVSGSSLSTSVVFGRVALPEMDRHGYDKSFSLGCIASAGTFASMIPPSQLFIIYSLFTDQPIARLFAAGIIPGLITATVYSMSIVYRAKYNPKLVPRKKKDKEIKLGKRILALVDIWPIILVAFIVLGGIYGGIFTPTEAAAFGCLAIFIIGIVTRGGTLHRLGAIREALGESAATTSMVFLIMIGALFYSRFLSISRIPTYITEIIVSADVPRYVILLGILVVWFLLGMIIVPVGIFALTLPIVFPVIVRAGYDPIWFGVIALKLTEIASVTPPVGLNIFALKGVVGKEVPISKIYGGIWPFVLCDLIVLVVLIAFPQIVLWLPNLLLGK